MHRISLALGVLWLALASCASVSVKYDYDTEVDFQKYRTYAWTVFFTGRYLFLG